MNWWWSQTSYTVTLKLSPGGKAVPGLPTVSSSLPCVANAGESVGAVLARLNTYRGPENQIVALFDSSGVSVSLTTVVTSDVTYFVRT